MRLRRIRLAKDVLAYAPAAHTARKRRSLERLYMRRGYAAHTPRTGYRFAIRPLIFGP